MGKYPRVKRKQFVNYRKTCVFCSMKTPRGIFIEVDEFRGNDEVLKVCMPCQSMFSNDELLSVDAP